jgi:hypothetical protein
MRTDRLDAWLGDPSVRTFHRRAAQAPPGELWDAAKSIRLADTRTLGRLVRWRIPGTPADLTFHELFRRYPFTLLEEDEDYAISGLCGRIWTLQRDYPRLEGVEDFVEWEESGTVRVLFAHWVEPGEDGASTLVSETRVEPTDRTARLRLRALWAVVGRFERLVGAEPLTTAARRAEGHARGRPAPSRP